MTEREVFWIKTVGAPSQRDPRDGELHQFFDQLPDNFDLEPWGDQGDGDPSAEAHYVRSATPHVTDDQGRSVWIFKYRPTD